MGRIVFDPSSRCFSAQLDGVKEGAAPEKPSLLSRMGAKVKDAAVGAGQRLKDAVRRNAPALLSLGAVGTAFALSNGRRNDWGRAELERNKKEKAEGLASEDPEVRKKAEGMSVMPKFRTVVAAPGYDTSPGLVNPYR